jgi:hypothetical protein
MGNNPVAASSQTAETNQGKIFRVVYSVKARSVGKWEP